MLCEADEWQRLCLQNGWRFILAESRTGQPAALRDFVLTRAEWRRALDNALSGAAESRRIQA